MKKSSFIGNRLRIFKQEVFVLFFALRHPSTPLLPKVVTALTLLYLISPLDAIPDFIPFFGYIDDLLIIPFLINISAKMLPMQVKLDSEQKARKHAKQLRVISIIILLVCIALMVWLFIAARDLIHYLFY